jgi:membrane protease YdiL (CAAX protease family)
MRDWRCWTWVAWCATALLALPVLSLGAGGVTAYGVGVPVSALIIAAVTSTLGAGRTRLDRMDLTVIGGLYVVVIVLFRLAFTVFGTENVLGLFLCFAAGMLVGMAGPVVYTVWVRHRPLSSLGIGADRWKAAASLGVVLAVVQLSVTLMGRRLPEGPEDWVPLLVMSLTVGAFETVFFRGFIQDRLRASAGQAVGVGGAAALYALYHVGYGMSGMELLFLFGLGTVYGVAYALVRNGLVLWPLLTPLGSFFNNLNNAAIELPWASILGFLDVLAVMAAVLLLARRHWRRSVAAASTPRASMPHDEDVT